MTGWRRRVLVIGALAVALFLVTVAFGSQSARVYESYIDAVSDGWGASVPCPDWNPHQQAQALRMLAVLLPYSLLTLPAHGSVTLLGIGDDVETRSAGWGLLMTANSLFWAVVLYGVWTGATSTRRWWRAR